MACEKLTKAHLCGAGSDPETLQRSHAYTAKNLHRILLRVLETRPDFAKASWIVPHAKHWAGEIEVLAPAVRRGGARPENCEYPWQDSAGRLHVPVDWHFSPSELLTKPAGRTFLKLVRVAIDEALRAAD
jgi:hypothetical protein